MRHEHDWARYFSPVARWDGTYRYRCIKCRECVESYTGAIPAIEAKLKEKNT